ncbi:hypothetical protein IX307_001164 [Bacteroides pyogenes]|nr:hypothetical protein [Bacteroides pyogenes]MBR8786850.1 hypothetical protein [Bacteroides pyogenes]MBR8792335.1 hypothetical protein [Bacteroides pyogenes]
MRKKSCFCATPLFSLFITLKIKDLYTARFSYKTVRFVQFRTKMVFVRRKLFLYGKVRHFVRLQPIVNQPYKKK